MSFVLRLNKVYVYSSKCSPHSQGLPLCPLVDIVVVAFDRICFCVVYRRKSLPFFLTCVCGCVCVLGVCVCGMVWKGQLRGPHGLCSGLVYLRGLALIVPEEKNQ